VTSAISAALRAAAAGLHPDEAATALVISHGCFLHRDDFTCMVHAGTSISDGATLMAWIDWDAVRDALSRGQFPASSSERHILQIAASIAAGHPVSLRDTIPGLDQRNLKLVTTAIRHAAGHHH
jgi:hypothetical protein